MTGSGSAVGYVLTHYPKLAQTFIANEIDAVERAGVAVRVFAMNAPETHELVCPGAEAKAARTTYLKPAIVQALGALLATTLRHPLAMAGVWRKAIASGGGNPARIVRRLSHLAQGAWVAKLARREGIVRLHAHFGLAPATIAWLATALTSRYSSFAALTASAITPDAGNGFHHSSAAPITPASRIWVRVDIEMKCTTPSLRWYICRSLNKRLTIRFTRPDLRLIHARPLIHASAL